MRLKNLAFAIVALLGTLQLSLAGATTDPDILYQFATSQRLSFSKSFSVDQNPNSQDLSFRPFLMVIDGNEPVALSGLFDRTHTLFNQNFKKLFHQLDDYFGDGQQVSRSNSSWARVRIDSIKSSAEDPRIKAAIKLRVVLPRAEKRFRLLFSTEDEQNSGAAVAQGSSTAEGENDEYSLALRFIRQARENGSINFDLGTRYRERKAQIFGRVNLFYAHDIAWNFRSSFSNSFYYYSASGYENKFRYDLTHPLKNYDSVLFRGSTELVWKDGQRGTLIGETLGIYSDIDDNRSIAVEGLGFYTTALNDEQTENFLGAEFRVRFRHNVWRRWFYYEVWPTMSWQPVNNYSASFGGLFRVEMVLGKF